IDCKQCVAVCPAGIDIRDGAQLECIQCALCIDACNAIMDKVGRPRGLIAYDTVDNLEAAARGERSPVKLLRPRVILYASLILLVGLIMLVALWNRTLLEVNVLRDRNPIFVQLSDGSVRNGYTVKILNKRHEPRIFRLDVRGLPGAAIRVVGHEKDADPQIEVPPDDLRALRVFVTLPPQSLDNLRAGATSFDFIVEDTGDATMVSNDTTFRSPAR
ncbi:MAG: cytochrome c oxidase accessory protein CcoG, partial [Alphaproteobacteria bacterium]